jgi:hypothetical protein
MPMHLDRLSNDAFGQFLMVSHGNAPWLFVALVRPTMEIEKEVIAAGKLSGPSGGFQLDIDLITHIAKTSGKLSGRASLIDLVEVVWPEVLIIRPRG